LKSSEGFRPTRFSGLPIFRCDFAEYSMFYAPGCLAVVSASDSELFEGELAPPGAIERTEVAPSLISCSAPDGKEIREIGWAAELWSRAEQAVTQEFIVQREPFRPECLTLFMNNECNLCCIYCHADHLRKPGARLESEAVCKAAEEVALNCRRKGLPLYAVFHGGGDPILHRDRVDATMKLLKEVASAKDVRLFSYVATNGICPEEKAYWLAKRFDLVGLSCDGPADVQNHQRPLWGGKPTSHILERTALILRNEGCHIHVRTTITRETSHRQGEIADYICNTFSPEEIHFEPVYFGGRMDFRPLIEHADDFVAHFLKARKIAKRHNILLTTSGSRPGLIHGPYCNVFRSVLNLVPGGLATACFKVSLAEQVIKKGAKIGELNSDTGHFELDQIRIQTLRKKLDTFLPQCPDCFNRYHCSRECPDSCPLDIDVSKRSASPKMGFRCRVQKAITFANLRETAKGLWKTLQDGNKEGRVCRVTGQKILYNKIQP